MTINFRHRAVLGHATTRRHTRYRPWVPKFIARKLGGKSGCTSMRRYMATLPPMRVRPLLGYERRRPYFCCECDRVHRNGAGSACVSH